MGELLPCPFCGSRAYIGQTKKSLHLQYSASCGNPHCIAYKLGNPFVAKYLTEYDAVKAWNTRTPLDIINRLRAENEQLCKRIKSQKKALFEQQSYTAELQAENERLQKYRKTDFQTVTKRLKLSLSDIEEIRAEARKEYSSIGERS